MDYMLLGKNNKQRLRRSKVYEQWLNGFKAKDISQKLSMPIRTVFNDIQFFESLPLEDTPDILRMKQFARGYWFSRLRHYSILENTEKLPSIRMAASRAKDEAAKELFKLLSSDIEERLIRLEKVVINAEKR